MTDRRSLRVGLVADMLEEHWPSMDLVAEMLMGHLDPARVEAILLRPSLRPRLSQWAATNGRPLTSDRIINRFWDYPRWLRRNRDGADVFHIVDHSYAHLTRELPPGRIVVTCHDTDAFRPLRNGAGRESLLPRYFVRRLVAGLRQADAVVCDSEATRRELVEWDLVPRERTDVVPNGVDAVFSPSPDRDAEAAAEALLGPGRHLDLLHVGSTIPRKRIDVVLRTMAFVRAAHSDVRLLRVGGTLTDAQMALARDLGVVDAIRTLPFVDRRTLAALYRRAALVLLPSEREGFGLPLIEALACGTPVIATALPVLQEVAGDAATYAALGDARAWSQAVIELLVERAHSPASWKARQDAGVARARVFSWPAYAARMADIYERVAGAPHPSARAAR